MMHLQSVEDHLSLNACSWDPEYLEYTLEYCNIDKALLMVSVAEEDRDALKFL